MCFEKTPRREVVSSLTPSVRDWTDRTKFLTHIVHFRTMEREKNRPIVPRFDYVCTLLECVESFVYESTSYDCGVQTYCNKRRRGKAPPTDVRGDDSDRPKQSFFWLFARREKNSFLRKKKDRKVLISFF